MRYQPCHHGISTGGSSRTWILTHSGWICLRMAGLGQASNQQRNTASNGLKCGSIYRGDPLKHPKPTRWCMWCHVEVCLLPTSFFLGGRKRMDPSHGGSTKKSQSYQHKTCKFLLPGCNSSFLIMWSIPLEVTPRGWTSRSMGFMINATAFVSWRL